ncbi:MAG: response regulator transcription factor [bacterium]|nr:response regulator transcription factor [bacterium]
MNIRSIIVDDEPYAIEVIETFLKEEQDFEIIGRCDNGFDAVKMINKEKPDLVFLDIQMPEMNGFEVLEALGSKDIPYVIFVTAYDKYAVKAFEINAIDYLLKPYDQDRFLESVNRAKELIFSKKDIKHQIKNVLDTISKERKFLDRILIRSGGSVFFLKAEDIDWIEAAAYYVKIHSKKNTYLIREAIGNIEKKLDPSIFMRIHRSYIVNIERIKELIQWSYNQYTVVLKDDTELNLSRNYRERIFNHFDITKNK